MPCTPVPTSQAHNPDSAPRRRVRRSRLPPRAVLAPPRGAAHPYPGFPRAASQGGASGLILESESQASRTRPARYPGGAMEPRVVADAVETGEEDVIMEALRTYNREVSESRERGTRKKRWGRVGRERGGRGAESVRSCYRERVRVRSPLGGWGGAPSVSHPRSAGPAWCGSVPLSPWVSLQNSQSFTFDDAQQEDRKVGADRGVKGKGWEVPGKGAWWSRSSSCPQRLAELLVAVLERGLPPSRRVTWLQSIRILTRDRSCLEPFTSRQSLQALASYAGIALEGSVPEPLDMDVVLESLKCLCNLVLSSPVAQVLAAEARLVVRLAERVGLYHKNSFPHEVQFFDLRLLFLLTALRTDARQQLFQELQGVRLLTAALELTLGMTPDGGPPELLPPQETERAMEILKVLFNITFDSIKREVDEVRADLSRWVELSGVDVSWICLPVGILASFWASDGERAGGALSLSGGGKEMHVLGREPWRRFLREVEGMSGSSSLAGGLFGVWGGCRRFPTMRP